MPRTVPSDYFYRDPWRPAGPLALKHYTCVTCAHRSPTFVLFQMHIKVCPTRTPNADIWELLLSTPADPRKRSVYEEIPNVPTKSDLDRIELDLSHGPDRADCDDAIAGVGARDRSS
jgi:hypothetical protein